MKHRVYRPKISDPDNPVLSHEERVLCSKCGCKGIEHRVVDGRCPATLAHGRPKPFPSFKHAGESAAAERKIDRALDKFWSSPHTFWPVR